MTTRLPTPTASPQAAKPQPETPPQSPHTKPTVAPPSTFTLPPSQLKSDGERESKIIPPEAKKKTVGQESTTVGKQRPFVGSDVSDAEKPKNGAYAKPKGRDVFWKSSDEEDSSVRAITIAGENRGAVMELGYTPRRRSVHKPVNEGELSGDEGRTKMQAEQHQNGKTKSGLRMNTFMNSNVQGVNSSIMFNSSCSHHDPGLHFSLSRKPSNGHAHQIKDHRGNDGNNFQRENETWFSN